MSNCYDYGARFYDPVIGRFVSIDRLASVFPWWTPYQYAGNTPVWAIDLDGLEPLFSTSAFFQALRQGETALQGSAQAGKTMSYYQKGAADGAMTGLSFSFSATRLCKIGIAAATVKNFNTTKAAFEVLGIEMPMIIDAVSSSVGGKMKGSNILSMGLNEQGLNKAANIIDLISDIKSIYKGATKDGQELIEGISSAIKDGSTALELTKTESSKSKPDNSNIPEKTNNNKDSKNKYIIMAPFKQKDEKED